jgi:hypothetical protein
VRAGPGAYAPGVRYCPNIPCPHRQRVGSPAEFFDHVTHCSDCGTRLVASEEDAVDGLRADARDPYRAAGAVPRGDRAAERGRGGEIAQALVFVAGAAAIALLGYLITGQTFALYLVLLGPVLQRARSGARRAEG